MNTSSITDWLMVVITFAYVVATVCIMLANSKSAKATRDQVDEMRRQFDEMNRPSVSVELVYEKRSFYMLRFTNHGNRTAEHVAFEFDPAFVDSLPDSFRKYVLDTKGKECVIGVGQHYDLILSNNKLRGKADLVPAKGVVTYKCCGREFSDTFSIDLLNYMTFYSVNSEEKDLLKAIKEHNFELKRIRMALEKTDPQAEDSTAQDDDAC